MSGAVITATIFGGQVTLLTIVNPGSGYSILNPPTIVISPPTTPLASTDQATATCTVGSVFPNIGKIVSVLITNNGANYTSTPDVLVLGGRKLALPNPQGWQTTEIVSNTDPTTSELFYAVSYRSAYATLRNYNLRLGRNSGGLPMSVTGNIALGSSAGSLRQGTAAVALGQSAGERTQGENAVAVGNQAGRTNQGSGSVALGFSSGMRNQGVNSIAIGNQAGATLQGSGSIAIGYLAGSQQAANSVVISALGTVVTGDSSFATYIAPIRNITSSNLIAYNTTTKELTYFASSSTTIPSGNIWAQALNWDDVTSSWQITGNGPLAFGNYSGQLSQGTAAVAIGIEAGRETQGSGAIAMGFQAGQTAQGQESIAIGVNAGSMTQERFSISIGKNAGQTNQKSGSIAIGLNAGSMTQGENAIAIGNAAGQTNQGSGSIAIGYLAGSQQAQNSLVLNASGAVVTGANNNATYLAPLRNASQPNVMAYDPTTNEVTYFPSSASTVPTGSIWAQALNWNDTTGSWQITGDGPLAFGNYAGQTNQGTAAIAVGIESGRGTQASGGIAIGYLSGNASQGTNAVAIGVSAGQTNQGSGSISIGFLAGQFSQGGNALSIGYKAGFTNQSAQTIAIGQEAGNDSQKVGAVAIGLYAGNANQGSNGIAIGQEAGYNFQQDQAIAIGYGSGQFTQGLLAVGIGFLAGQNTQGQNAIAIGEGAGQNSQGSGSIAIGRFSGGDSQDMNSIGLGNYAGQTFQQSAAIAVGFSAGAGNQGTNAIAIGLNAGQGTQGVNSIAIGNQAGRTNQGSGSVAIGYLAGSQQAANSVIISALGTVLTGATASATYLAPLRNVSQPNIIAYNTSTNEVTYFPSSASSVPTGSIWAQALNWNDLTNSWQITGNGPLAFGNYAGQTNQGTSAIAIGIEAGRATQSSGAIAMGFRAGQNTQGTNSIAIGSFAAQDSQNNYAVAIGSQAGQSAQGTYGVALGEQAGQNTQGRNAISIGRLAGEESQGENSVGVGIQAGQLYQGSDAVAIGNQAGQNTQSPNAIAIGQFAGTNSQNRNAIGIGVQAGQDSQGSGSIAIGLFSGQTSQAWNSIALGIQAGQGTQGTNAISIGYQAGNTNQGSSAIAIGLTAGQGTQGTNAIAIGKSAGQTSQQSGGIAIGFNAGAGSQGLNSIAIGVNTGMTLQGANSIAIGANAGSQQAANSVVISALGTVVTGASTNAMYLAPLRNISQPNVMAYNPTTNEVSYFPSSSSTVPTGSIWAQALNWNDTTGSWQITGNGPLAFANYAGQSGQETAAIAIGIEAGRGTQGSGAIAIGLQSGWGTQGINSLALGIFSGQTQQGENSVAIGSFAGQGTQGLNSVAIGSFAGQKEQKQNSVSIGILAGQNYQGTNGVALGKSSGQNSQGQNAIAIGSDSGNSNQGTNSIAIGKTAGNTTQGMNAIAIGTTSGQTNQGSGSIAIGFGAGISTQGINAIAIGNSAGQTMQGSGSISIGYLAGSQQAANSVVISALGTVVTGAMTNATYLAPIRNAQTNLLVQYNTSTNELSYSGNYTGSIGQIAARQIDATYLEMNGQILNQSTYATLYAAIGNQPEYVFNRVNLNPGLSANSSLFSSSFAAGNYNADKNGSTLIMVGTNGTIMRSTDSGATWFTRSFQSLVSGVVGLNVIRYVANWGSSGRWILGGNGTNIQGYSDDNGITWATPSTGSYNRFAFDFNSNSNVGIFVGSGSFIYRSTDGVTWTSIVTILQTPVIGFTTFPTLYSVAYGRVGGTTETWVAVGDRSTLIYSTDNGLTWTVYAFATITSAILYYVKYIGGTINRFYAVGTDEIFYSSNGSSWTRVTNVNFNVQYQVISDTAQTCVVISSQTGINYSTDGTTFNVYTPTASNNYLAITFDSVSSKFFATGNAGMIELAYTVGTLSAPVRYTLSRNVIGRCILVGGTSVYMGTENAGILNYNISTTAVGTSVEPGYNLRRASYGNNTYVTISLDARSSLFYSADALSWTYVALDSVTNYQNVLYDIKYINSRFVVTANGTVLWESTTGSTWTPRTTPSFNKYVVIWTGTNYIFGCNAGYILYTPDLITYTSVLLFTAPATGEDIDVWDLIHLGSGVVVAVMSNGWTARSTNHGATWTTVYVSPVGSYSFVNLAYDSGNDVLVTCTREGAIVAYSNDKGVSWNVYEAPTPYSGSTLQGVVFGNGVFLTYGTINMIGISTNGSTWEWVATPGGYDIYSITFSAGVFMAAGLLNNATARTPPVVLWSLDGRNWTSKVVPHSLILGALGPKQEVFYGGGKWFVPSYAGTQSSIIWVADNPYDFSTNFQIPTRYLGTGNSKLWIKAS